MRRAAHLNYNVIPLIVMKSEGALLIFLINTPSMFLWLRSASRNAESTPLLTFLIWFSGHQLVGSGSNSISLVNQSCILPIDCSMNIHCNHRLFTTFLFHHYSCKKPSIMVSINVTVKTTQHYETVIFIKMQKERKIADIFFFFQRMYNGKSNKRGLRSKIKRGHSQNVKNNKNNQQNKD